MDTLRNAFDVYHKWHIIKYEKFRPRQGAAGPGFGGPTPSTPPPSKVNVSLYPAYAGDEKALHQLREKINFLRKRAPGKRDDWNKVTLIADLPMMAKL